MKNNKIPRKLKKTVKNYFLKSRPNMPKKEMRLLWVNKITNSMVGKSKLFRIYLTKESYERYN